MGVAQGGHHGLQVGARCSSARQEICPLVSTTHTRGCRMLKPEGRGGWSREVGSAAAGVGLRLCNAHFVTPMLPTQLSLICPANRTHFEEPLRSGLQVLSPGSGRGNCPASFGGC